MNTPDHPTFNLLRPPPQSAPPTAADPELWSIQLHWWWRHTPAGLGHRDCRLCHRPWPCPSWFHWDDLLRRNRTGA
ncbi:hypothetical protein Afil01_42660 [Actinorhabdospora filicis]|uniref:Uncharacterized protein n=1 Tax=Actinorhabdospora filicis TaxID=1785913 RepID=A0A9W6WAA4_9ACTN|nr:hypothetical protein [Actinorhabdospora filicis]GLZ79459.1 hypothetical protein Afil01_42660 [Actinorhabdospora filicis]